jgi:membrane protein
MAPLGEEAPVREWKEVLVDAGKGAKRDALTDLAAALAYYGFLAVPAVLLVVLGVFSSTAGTDTIESLIGRLEGIVPEEALTLLQDSLTRASGNQGSSLVMIVVGLLLALWTAIGAMNALMRGLNTVFGCEETRSFARQKLTGLGMLACALLGMGLTVALLVLGPVLADKLGDALDMEEAFGWIWWTVQWPILILGLLVAFAGVLYLGPNVDLRRFSFFTPGALVAVIVWLVASGLFSYYVSNFASYNKAWGSLATVVIMLIWLWLSALALLFGAEVNVEAERRRGQPQGDPVEGGAGAPAKA